MPGQVFTFERAPAGFTSGTPLDDAINAIAVAAADQPRIRYEVITEAENPRPMVVVVFPDAAAMESFSAKLPGAIAAWGLQLREVLTTKSDDA